MCLSPIIVKNPTRFFQDGISHTLLKVRCGHCAECQKENSDDWFVRAFFEWKEVKRRKGQVYFILLTYDEEHVPEYVDDIRGFRCPCFNPKHLKHFRDTLRMCLLNDGKPHTGIKYKICAEFGGKYGRPHYHALLFVPYEFPLEYVRGKWNHAKRCYENGLIQRAWPYGFVSWSKKHGCEVKSDAGIQYAMKYVNKEDKWTIKYRIPSYLESLKQDLAHANGPDEVEALRDRISKIRRVLPRHFTSVGFGSAIIDLFRKSDGSFDIDRLVDGHIDLSEYGKQPSLRNTNWQFNIPQFIMRKICYDCEDGLWTRNGVGLDVAMKRHELSKYYTKLKYEPYFDIKKAKAHLESVMPNVMDDVRDDYDLDSDIKDIARIMRGRSLDDLVMYSKVYSGVPLAYNMDDGVLLDYNERYYHEGRSYDFSDKEHNSYIAATDGMSDSEMMDFFRNCEKELLFSQLCPSDTGREPDPLHGARCHRPGFSRKRTSYGNFHCFEGFDDVLMIIDKWERLYNSAVQNASEVEKDRIDKILALNGSGWICEGEL